MKLLVIGAPRSGTTFVARYLQKRGMRVGHEKTGLDGCVSWLMAAREAPFPSELAHGPGKEGPWGPVIHLVRNPRDVISSMTTMGSAARRFIAAQFPSQRTGDDLLAWWWVQWNLLCEKQAHFRVRVEDLAVEGIGRPNARSHRKATFAAVASSVNILAKKYGYEI